ncbi:hypothetical protein HNR65_002555 [Desulfosalsimonas propionicica]|uniref:Uncharacterized protein n=1 Tax=Desulfosalsimonas propionicica TaxID=332175 RepID=A0A7W0HLD3_9BACT|nr:hypothetical protein [Desulfosalsimonas propionicica]MBA2882214.1 hypothetical protein [Desulfosalsimonas propionicica]
MMKVLHAAAPDLPVLRFETQKAEENIRPDMWGYDNDGPRVFIENKFWAGLTEHQPVSYLEKLAAYNRPSIILFVVPDAREQILWRELCRRLQEAGIAATGKNTLSGPITLAAATATGPVMALASWTRLISALALSVADDPFARNDLAQLQALCEAADIDAFVPILPRHVTDQRMPAFVLQLNAIVQASVELAVSENILTLNGLKPQASWNRIGRYIKFSFENGPGVWVGLHFDLWKQYGETLLWMVFSQTDWGRALQSKPLLEPWAAREDKFVAFQNSELAIALNLVFGEDKDHVVRRLAGLYKDIADALCPPGA